MHSRRFIATVVSLLSAASLLGGCVAMLEKELNNRGGFIDSKLDTYWIEADTKQMRVLRAYVLIGSFARMSREGIYKSERENLVQHVNSAVNVANDAFICAYSVPGRCVYFDERMAEMEVAILRLAVAVLTKHENESLFSTISKELGEGFPALKAADSLGKLVDALDNGVNLTSHGLKLVKSIITLGTTAYLSGRRFGALYRDSIELHMVTVLASLDYNCRSPRFTGTVQKWAAKVYYDIKPASQHDACAARNTGWKLWQNGAGNLQEWRHWLSSTEVTKFSAVMIPDQNAFAQASDLIWRACEHIAQDAELQSKCIGRRPRNKECGCIPASKEKPTDNCAILTFAALDDGKKDEAVKQWTESKVQKHKGYDLIDACPLIEFPLIWDRRRGRDSPALARLDYLSVQSSYYRPDEAFPPR